jgi:hypothetical protein
MVGRDRNPVWARVLLGVLVFLLILGFVFGIGWAILKPLNGLGKSFDAKLVAQVNEALIMFFAGGLGSGLYAIRAYLLHACQKKDVDPAYIPWYPFWMLSGALLGLIFYFTLRGGLLFLTINGEQTAIESLNSWSLAAVGSMVGLFSKYALEKLREVFLTLFGNKSGEVEKIDAILEALPEDVRKKVAESLKKVKAEEE